MGRSVSRPTNARVAYTSVTLDEDDDDLDWYSNYQDDAFRRAKRLWPSLEPCDKWLDSEDHAIGENAYAYFGLSEYCGVIAIWLAPKDPPDWFDGGERVGWRHLRDHWLDLAEAKLFAEFGTLVREGSMSNGESVFRRVGAAA